MRDGLAATSDTGKEVESAPAEKLTIRIITRAAKQDGGWARSYALMEARTIMPRLGQNLSVKRVRALLGARQKKEQPL